MKRRLHRQRTVRVRPAQGGKYHSGGSVHIHSSPIYLPEDGFIFSGSESQPVGVITGTYQQMINKSMTLMATMTNTTILKHKTVLNSI